MIRVVALDTGPLGILTHPKGSPDSKACNLWLEGLLEQGVRVVIAEVNDYELRREYLFNGSTNGIKKLDALIERVEYIPLDSAAMRLAAQLWAAARKKGITTCDRHAIDGDCIMVCQVLLDIEKWGYDREKTMIATVDPGDLGRLASVELGESRRTPIGDVWRNIVIKPDTVPIYDPQDKTVTPMPARGLAPGMVQALIDDMLESVYVHIREMPFDEDTPYRSGPFPPEVMMYMQELSDTLKAVHPLSAAEWEDGFRKDTHPVQEIRMWLLLARTYKQVVAEQVSPSRPHNIQQKQKADYFRLLLQCLNAEREHVLKTTDLRFISEKEAEAAMAVFYGDGDL